MTNMGNMAPSAQRKILLKEKFDKMLLYYLQDIQYSLIYTAQKKQKDL